MFDRISSVGNAGRVSAREQMAREVLGEPSASHFECIPVQPFHGRPTMGVCARDVQRFDAAPPLLRRVIGDCARQTTVRHMLGEDLKRAESRKVADCAMSVLGFCPTWDRRSRSGPADRNTL
jgi:hypothetical protein